MNGMALARWTAYRSEIDFLMDFWLPIHYSLPPLPPTTLFFVFPIYYYIISYK